jgi:hypothetical protein
MPIFDQLLRSKGDEHTKDDNPNFADEGTPTVNRFGR